jgi:predicted nucleic acid-binding protein
LTVYADSSFIVSLYLTDQHSPDSRRRVLTAPQLWFTPLHGAEWAHAVAQHVFRGNLSLREASAMHKQREQDEAAGVWLRTDVPENSFEVCAELGRRYGPKLGVRTLDSLHVASALALKADQFWTFDDRQRKLARAVGLTTR